MSRSLFVAVACAVAVHANAQITLEAAGAGRMRVLHSLQVGPKVIQGELVVGQDTVTVYNFDLSVYRHLVIPAPPAGYTWSSLRFVTEALFDTDSTTLEYTLMAAGSNPGQYHFAIVREEGTVLFSKTPGVCWDVLGSGIEHGSPIVQTNSGAKLLLADGMNGPSEVYALPGSMPCLPGCDGALITGVGEEFAPPSGPGLFLFPNPADEGAEVLYQLPQGAGQAELIFYTTAGQQVLQLPVPPNSERMHISTAQLPAGTYLYQLRAGTEVMGGPRLVVVH